jgi:hypothetical protein
VRMLKVARVSLVLCGLMAAGMHVFASALSFTVNGIVSDSTGKPVAGAVVTIDKQAVSTSSDGHYAFTAVAAGRHRMSASKQGLVTATAAVEVRGHTAKNFTLRLESFRSPTSPDPTPQKGANGATVQKPVRGTAADTGGRTGTPTANTVKISLFINPAILDFKAPVTGTVRCSPSGSRIVVSLSSDAKAGTLSMPASVVIPADKDFASFSITSLSGVYPETSVNVTAAQAGTAGVNGSSAQQRVTLRYNVPSVLTRLCINGDNGTGTATFVNGTAVTLSAYLSHEEPVGSIAVSAPFAGGNLPFLNITPNTKVAGGLYNIHPTSPVVGRKTPGSISAEWKGSTITRKVEVLPKSLVEKVCFFDITPVAGYYSITYDYSQHEISPAQVVGGQVAHGFIRRGFALPDPVYVDIVSSDPGIATVEPSSLVIKGSYPQERGGLFNVTTQPTNGAPRTVTIKVIEGGTWEWPMTLTIK